MDNGGSKVPGLLLASWRSRRANGVGSRRANGIGSRLSLKAEDHVPKSVRQRERILSYLAFYSIQILNRLDEAQPHWEKKSSLLILM